MHKSQNKPNNTVWLWTIFATAMGAGVLYLPVNAGINGIWPIITIALISIPMIYLSHKNLSKVILSGSKNTTNINEIINENFSKRFSKFFAICYFLATYPLILIYSVGLTNTINSFLTNVLGITPISRALLALIILSFFVTALSTKPRFIRKMAEMVALPLAGSLFLISVYLIPQWNLDYLYVVPSYYDFFETLWITLPVVIFSYNFAPIVSTFALNYLKNHESPEQETELVLWRSTWLLFVFIMFFIISCVLTVDQDHMLIAKNQNMNILVYIGKVFDDPILRTVSPIIATIAMTGAFLGNFFGAKESVIGLIEQKLHKYQLTSYVLDKIAISLIIIPSYIMCIIDTNILNVMSILCGPVIAVLLFIFPVYAIYNLPNLAQYKATVKDKYCHVFILIIGLISCSAILYSFKYLKLFLK